MSSIANARLVKERFEGTEAIYSEKGSAFRVRVLSVTPSPSRRYIAAVVEEVFTPERADPSRWEIGAGDLSRFSEYSWSGGGYGLWSMYNQPELVRDVIDATALLGDEVPDEARYLAVALLIGGYMCDAELKSVFPEDD
jgi:hypothetical protein